MTMFANSMYQEVLQTLSDGVCIIDKDYRILFWNKRLEQWSRRDRSEFEGRVLTDIYPHLLDVAYKTRIDQVLEHGPPAFFSMLLHHHMFPFESESGALQAQRVTVSPLLDEQGRHLALFTVVDMTRSVMRENKYRDILASYERELGQRKALELRNAMLVRAVDKAAEAFVIMRTSGEIEYANKAFVDQTGWQADADTVSYWQHCLSGLGDVEEVVRRAVLSGEAWQGRCEIRKQDGSLFTASVSIAPIVNEQGKVSHAVVVQEDISEQLKFEEQYRKSQKQEALATLIGGIAHDFNNLLSGMMGHLYLAGREVREMPKTAVRLEKIQTVANEIAGIVQQLMTFARKGEVDKRQFPLNSFVKEFTKLVNRTIPENIRFHIDFEQGKFPCQGDVEGLQQALLNMVQNSVEATAGKENPEITLRLARFKPEAHTRWVVRHPVLAKADYAHISIADNGSGIDAACLDKIFDPFFTTKALGSGLGLAVAIGNIKNSQGLVDVESSPQGTTMHIWLPLLAEEPTQHSVVSVPVRHANQTILLVDDDTLVRNTSSEILDMLGYRVLEAEDGQYAVDIMQEKGADIDLIIMDMVMPRMTGSVAAAHIREMYPDIPIIFATAYDKSISIKATANFSHSVLISKPFHPDVLQAHIEDFIA